MTRHRFDPLSFIFGALFVAVAAIGLIDRELVAIADLRWIAPGLLVAAGALLLVLSARRAGTHDGGGADSTAGPEHRATSDLDEGVAAVEGEVPER